jgi:hypothetical protein
MLRGRRPKPKDPAVTLKGPYAPDRELYERQPWETELAWSAFLVFRDLDPHERSVKKASDLIAVQRQIPNTEGHYNTVLDWSGFCGWRARVEAWDLAVDKERRKKLLKDAADMRERHAKLGKGMQRLGGIGLRRLLAKAEGKEKFTISPGDVQRLIDLGIRVEREAHGEPGSIVEERQRLTSEEERESMRSLLSDKDALAAARTLVKKLNAGD